MALHDDERESGVPSLEVDAEGADSGHRNPFSLEIGEANPQWTETGASVPRNGGQRLPGNNGERRSGVYFHGTWGPVDHSQLAGDAAVFNDLLASARRCRWLGPNR